MINLKAALIERYPPFHPTSLRARFRFPNFYYVSSISDFVENRDAVQPTPDGLFQWNWNKGRAAIVLYNCDYQRKKPRIAEPNQLWYQDLSFHRLIMGLIKISGKNTGDIQQKIDTMLDAYHDATIADMSGELAVRSWEGNIPSSARLYQVLLGYEPRTGLRWIVHADAHGPSIADRTIDAVIAENAGMLPRFSPA